MSQGVMQMICQWDSYLSLLPGWMRKDVDKQGRESLTELRLRLNQQPRLVMRNRHSSLPGCVTTEDIQQIINSATRFSPWASDTLAKGFISGPGGHRIGVCGQAIHHQSKMTGIRAPSSLCIRVARDFPGIAEPLKEISGSILIIGPPGSGKTTLLRDLIRQKSDLNCGSVGVVDERGELFPIINEKWGYSIGRNTDVLSGCGKKEGIEILLRTMSPVWIAVDEISSEDDCNALIKAGWCGVKLIATAHAENKEEFMTRPVYQPVMSCGLFDRLLCLDRSQTWKVERM